MDKLEARYEELYKEHAIENGMGDVTRFQSPEEYRKYLSETKGIDIDPNDKLVREFEEHLKRKDKPSPEELISRMVLPPFKREWQKKHGTTYPKVLFKQWPRLNQNAHLYVFEEGGIVVFDTALFHFLFASAGLVVRSRAFLDVYFKNGGIDITPVENEQVIPAFITMIQEIINEGRVSEELVMKYSIFPHEGGMSEISGRLTANMMAFIIAHELAHLHLSHKPINNKQGTLRDSFLASMYSQGQEMEADEFALDMLMDKDRIIVEETTFGELKNSNEDLYERMVSFQYMGIMLFFDLLSWRHGIQWNEIERRTGKKLDAYYFSHPTNEMRLLNLIEEKMFKKHPWIQGTANINGVLRVFKEQVIAQYPEYYK